MARAFTASVPLALVLVASFVVPLALIPGSFGYHRWPSDMGPGERSVRVDSAPPRVVDVEAAPEPAEKRPHVTVASRPERKFSVADRRSTAEPRGTTTPQQAPPADPPAAPAPSAPSAEDEPASAPAPADDPPLVAQGPEPGILRDTAPVPAPEVAAQVEVQPDEPAEPAERDEGDDKASIGVDLDVGEVDVHAGSGRGRGHSHGHR